jgi:cbb3-type cytochrome oxidase subunit 3
MNKARVILILGIWTALLPYLGFPYSWKNFLMIFTGIILLYVSYTLYKESKEKADGENKFDNFSENSDFN